MTQQEEKPSIPLTAEDISKISDIRVEEFKVPVWDKWVYVRGMTSKEYAEYMSWVSPEDLEKIQKATTEDGEVDTEDLQVSFNIGISELIRIASWCLCDKEGTSLFNGDVEQLEKHHVKAITAIGQKGLSLSGLNEDVEGN